MTNDVVIKCKQCEKKFSRLEWMTNKNCDNPNCSCPEVKKVAAQANTAIQVAKQKAGFNVTKKIIPIPTQCDSTKDQYFIEVEPLIMYEIHKAKKK